MEILNKINYIIECDIYDDNTVQTTGDQLASYQV